jgi:hypothetical protein
MMTEDNKPERRMRSLAEVAETLDKAFAHLIPATVPPPGTFLRTAKVTAVYRDSVDVLMGDGRAVLGVPVLGWSYYEGQGDEFRAARFAGLGDRDTFYCCVADDGSGGLHVLGFCAEPPPAC